MTDITCGKCIACTKFNGRAGNGYQPCHNPKRPVPPDVPTPPIQVLYPAVDEVKNDHWSVAFYWGAFIGMCAGMAIGVQLAKVL